MTPLRRRRAARRAAVYVRVDPGKVAANRAQQEADCAALADAHGWAVAHVYADTDTGRGTRPEFDRMVDDIRAGKIQAVAVWHVDALVRRNPELEPLIALCDEHGVDLATVTGEIDLATDGGRNFARQLGAFSRYQAAHRAEKAETRNEARAEAGQPWVSGTRCYGYAADGVTIIPEEAATIRDVADRIVSGESIRSICLQLNEAGKFTTRGKPWHATALRRLITNPRLTGKRVYRGKVTDGEWEPILTVKQQTELVAVLDERTAASPGRKSAGTPRRYLLTGGLLICGLCGNALSSQPSGAKKRGYVCRKDGAGHGCGRIRIAADPIENEAAERVLARLASPAVRRRLAAALLAGDEFDGERILDRIAAEEGKLAELGRDYADGLIGRVEFHAARDRVQARLDDLRQNAAGAARLRSLPGLDPESLAAWWEDADLQRRRDLVSLVLDHVVVGKATRFGPVGLDEDRLTWVWRVD